MRRAFRLAAPVLALLALPQFVAAEPITWEYKTRLIYDQDYGSKFTVALMPGERTSTAPGDYYQITLLGSTGVARPDPLAVDPAALQAPLVPPPQ